MMTLARAQAGKQHLRPTTVDVDAVIADSIATYAPIASAKGINLRHDRADASAVLAYADREATLTIANNVIGNAIRYTPEGGEVVVSSRRDGEFAVFSVRDNGIGIPQQEQRRVFERFYRADKSRKHTSSGTGLGLAIVKNLTQSQGGRVSLKSRPGKGSTFEIYLPEPNIAATTSPPKS
jgi:two-component system phosphate regulon sensor histidine kinase PhoR